MIATILTLDMGKTGLNSSEGFEIKYCDVAKKKKKKLNLGAAEVMKSLPIQFLSAAFIFSNC